MDLNDVLAHFNASQQGDYYILCCPKCGRKEAYCYVDDINKWVDNHKHRIPIRCNRLNKCGQISYLNDYIDNIDASTPLKIKESSPIKISQEGIMYIQRFCHYVTQNLECNMSGFNFGIRGISNETLKENNIIYYDRTFQFLINTKETTPYFSQKYRTANYMDRDLLIPIMNEKNETERLLLRSTFHLDDDKYKKEIQVMLKKRGLEIWNIRHLFDDKKNIIYVTEGVYDALSILEVSNDSSVGAIALPGVGKYKQLIKIIENHPEFKQKHIILAFDNDDAGEKMIKKAINDFYEKDIKVKRFIPKPYKDCNEFLQKDKEEFSNAINNKTKKIKEKNYGLL